MMVYDIIKEKSIDLIAKIAGGASMFNFSGKNDNESIGTRNVIAVTETLKKLGIPIVSKKTGGNIGRTMIVYLDDFSVDIKTANREIIKL